MNKHSNFQVESQLSDEQLSIGTPSQASAQVPSGYKDSFEQISSEQGESDLTALHPVLQAALSSLDIDLEDELARYRRQAPARVSRSRQEAMAYVASLSGKTHREASESLAIAPSSSSDDQASFHTNMTHFAAAQGTDSAIPVSPHSSPDSYLESSEELLRSLEELQTPVELPESSEESERSSRMWASLLTPLGVGSMLLLILSSATLGYLVVNPSVITRLGAPSEENASGSVGDRSTGRPDGISPDLASNEFDPLNLNRLSSISPGRELAPLESAADTTENSGQDDADSSSESIDLPTVSVPSTAASQPSTVTPASAAPSPSTNAAPTRTAPARNSSQSASLPRVEPTPAPAASTPSRSNSSNSSQARSSSPAASSSSSSGSSGSNTSSRSGAPAPSASSSASVASSPASQEDYVYVVTPYTGDNSLEQAQQAVSGAYVRNFPGGAQVQMGAFSNPQGAQDLVEELNNQGIPAQIRD